MVRTCFLLSFEKRHVLTVARGDTLYSTVGTVAQLSFQLGLSIAQLNLNSNCGFNCSEVRIGFEYREQPENLEPAGLSGTMKNLGVLSLQASRGL